MKLGLINSAWVQANQPTVFGLRKTKEIGFDAVDIFVEPLEIGMKKRRLIEYECDRLELPITSIACVAVGLIDFNPSVQRFHIERVKAYLDLAYEYQADNVLLVIGEYIWNQEVIPPAEQWKTGVENCKLLGDYAANLGVQIARRRDHRFQLRQIVVRAAGIAQRPPAHQHDIVPGPEISSQGGKQLARGTMDDRFVHRRECHCGRSFRRGLHGRRRLHATGRDKSHRYVVRAFETQWTFL